MSCDWIRLDHAWRFSPPVDESCRSVFFSLNHVKAHSCTDTQISTHDSCSTSYVHTHYDTPKATVAFCDIISSVFMSMDPIHIDEPSTLSWQIHSRKSLLSGFPETCLLTWPLCKCLFIETAKLRCSPLKSIFRDGHMLWASPKISGLLESFIETIGQMCHLWK